MAYTLFRISTKAMKEVYDEMVQIIQEDLYGYLYLSQVIQYVVTSAKYTGYSPSMVNYYYYITPTDTTSDTTSNTTSNGSNAGRNH